ncbi:hypothetical protein [Saccharomonospora sp.]|uniref:hypothetical protein n=1 Tax=Saccharomonospora sp. TaxID=33913 RepID=UPI00263937AA|nr:hypothetical protein [Saccharomonospora sp.]
MAVRLDVDPLKFQQSRGETERETTPAFRRARLNLNFVKFASRKKPTPFIYVDDPLALRYMCRV